MDYDLLPYRSLPYVATHPEHVGALAWMFGLDTALPDRARVLELGCASGGNLIPLAARYPDGQFVGVDLSERHVRDGQAAIDALGLTNVTITQADIAEAQFPAESFDYILCHGVYSWIPPEAQQAVFDIAARCLTPDGVLYVSYNIYPGWHLRKIVRDLCLYHAGSEGTPELRVARARWALKQMAENTSDDTPYGQSLRHEAKITAKSPDSYILGEFLATHNAPCYFHEFATRAAARGLSYLSETELRSSLPEAMPGGTGELVRKIAGDDGLAAEQYMDFFGGRQFRRSLLMRADQGARISRSIRAERLTGLHLCSALTEGAPDKPGGPIPFGSGTQQVLAADPLTLALFRHLQAIWPDTCTPEELRAYLVAEGVVNPDSDPGAFLRALMTAIVRGAIRALRQPRRLGRAYDPYPEVWPLARWQAESGQSLLTSQAHDVVRLGENNVQILSLMDGTRTHEAIAEGFANTLLDGRLNVTLPENASHTDVLRECRRLVQQSLDLLQRQAMLLRKNT